MLRLFKKVSCHNVLLIITGISCLQAKAQITSPSLGKTNDGIWIAAGLRQNLDSTGRTQSMTFIGNGRTSSPGDYDLVYRNSIWVFNQEFIFRCKHIFQPSTGISFRRQNEYSDESPYPAENPAFRYEIRVHARMALQYKTGRFGWNIGLRQDLRKFFAPDFRPWAEDVQLRSRIKAQCFYAFNAKHRLTLSAESFFASSHYRVSTQWNPLTYRETRFYFSYSLSPTGRAFTWSIGYMNNLLGRTHPIDVHCLMMDVTWKNIFHKK